MANKEHLAILMEAMEKDDIEIWNQLNTYLSNVEYTGANLSNTTLIGKNLIGGNFDGVNFTNTNLSSSIMDYGKLISTEMNSSNLSHAKLSNADMALANLENANLTNTDLNQANLYITNLTNATLKETNLVGTVFTQTTLKKSNFENAICGNTTFANLDLSEVRNLDKVRHSGPSTVGIDTLYKSGGNIPEIFLRGCGVPDNMIAYAKSLVDKPIDYYSCFISYSTANEDFAELLYNTLQGAGIRCWYAPEQLLPGQRIDDGIHRGIQYWDKVLFCASKSSLTEKWWVDFEVDKAFKKSRDLQRERGEQVGVLIPLNLDGYMFSDEYKNHPRASQFETTLAADFVGWKNDMDKFNREVKRVIKALQTDGGLEKPPPSKL